MVHFIKTIVEAISRQVRDARLKNKLVFSYISVTAVAIFVIGISTYLYSINTYKTEMIDKSNEIMNQIGSNIEYNIKNIDTLVNFLYMRSDHKYTPIVESLIEPKPEVPSSLLSIEREFARYFNDLVYLRDDCAGIFIHADNGFEYCRSIFGTESNYNINQEWYARTINNGTNITVVGAHKQFYMSDGIQVFSVSKRLVNPINKEFIGVMMIDFDLRTIKDICQGINLGENSRIAICDSEMNIIYNTDSNLMVNKLEPEIASAVNNEKMGITHRYMDGKEQLVIFNTSDKAGLKLISIIPIKSLTQRWKFIGFLTLMVGILLMAIMICISLIISSSITRPILLLNGCMKKVGKGDYEVGINTKSGDEIGQLIQGFNSMVNKIKELIRKEFASKLMEREAELKALQAQINPHFLYNTLEMISTIAFVEKVPQIHMVAVSLARMLRYSIKTMGDIVPLSDEIKHVEDYLNLYKMRFDYNIQAIYNISEVFFDYGIMKLTIQPLIENALIHGFQKANMDGVIKISVYEEGDDMLVEICDNGVGMREDTFGKVVKYLEHDTGLFTSETDTSESIGLRNINSRLALYYGQKYGLSITSRENAGTTILLKVPKQEIRRKTDG